MKIETEIKNIKSRNKRVEADKAWETSNTRRLIISIFTYIVVVVFMWSAGIEKPLINAVIPAVAFVLSTLSISFLKEHWKKKFQK